MEIRETKETRCELPGVSQTEKRDGAAARKPLFSKAAFRMNAGNDLYIDGIRISQFFWQAARKHVASENGFTR
jgi:hypothetical protein